MEQHQGDKDLQWLAATKNGCQTIANGSLEVADLYKQQVEENQRMKNHVQELEALVK